MGLEQEITKMRTAIRTDAYAMSVGELMNLYRDKELDVHPEFQRFFRWTVEQKSRFIESILLGIPIPQVFVAQREDGIWDVVDGIQRLSTIFQLAGILRDEDGRLVKPLILTRTKYLPSLKGKVWKNGGGVQRALTASQRLVIKRAKVDLSIILRESDDFTKYELFQRLNTGGSELSDQEVRNCILVMENQAFFHQLRELASLEEFQECIALTDRAQEEQYDMELLVRFLVLSEIDEATLSGIGDLGQFLTDEIVGISQASGYNFHRASEVFRWTFGVLHGSLESHAFRRYDQAKHRFQGGFLVSAFEALALGLAFNYQSLKGKEGEIDVESVARNLWSNPDFLSSSGSGIRASQRIPKMVRLGRELFAGQ